MSTANQSFEVMAKEITIAVIQKCSLPNDQLLNFALKSYDEIYKQLLRSYKEARK